MKHGILTTNFGEYADPRHVARVAQLAEASGWDGLFVWDHLAFVWGAPSGDPWVILTAAALATQRLRLGTCITPIPRRRPHVLAQTLATLDILSHGRMVLGVGLGGAPIEFTAFGEPGDIQRRAAMLDEGLQVVTRLWSGEPVVHRGEHYRVDNVTLAPAPVQRPRIPIWVGAEKAPALRRAARWDGWVVSGISETEIRMSPAQVADKVAFIQQYREGTGPYEVVFAGYSQPKDRGLVSEYQSAGATWWLESLHDIRGSFAEMLERAKGGPPG